MAPGYATGFGYLPAGHLSAQASLTPKSLALRHPTRSLRNLSSMMTATLGNVGFKPLFLAIARRTKKAFDCP